MSTFDISGQDLSKHHWKNRLILIYSDSEKFQSYKKQIDILKSRPEGMQDRKIMVYRIVNGKYQTGLSDQEEWYKSDDLTKLRKHEGPFEVLLIGLDGGIKAHWDDPVSTNTLFSVIDKMPMRQSELRSRRNGHEN